MIRKLYCKCGCGQPIIYKPHHKHAGIPDYLVGHHMYGKPAWSRGKTKEDFPQLAQSKELRDQIRKTRKKHAKEIEERRKNNPNAGMKGKHFTLKSRQLMRESHLGQRNSLEKRAKIRKTMKEGYASGRIKVNLNFKFCETSIELAIESELRKTGLRYIKQFSIKKVGIVDFFLPDFDLIIECDGDYWHNLEGRQKRDSGRDFNAEFLHGYQTIRFWEHEINESSEKCMRKINSVINRKAG